jgi:nicotinic acid mononucleotide adenylyltransferase
VCVARGDGTGAQARAHSNLPYVHFVDSDMPDMSSTLVRQRLKLGQPLDDLMYPRALSYLLEKVIPQMPSLQPKE